MLRSSKVLLHCFFSLIPSVHLKMNETYKKRERKRHFFLTKRTKTLTPPPSILIHTRSTHVSKVREKQQPAKKLSSPTSAQQHHQLYPPSPSSRLNESHTTLPTRIKSSHPPNAHNLCDPFFERQGHCHVQPTLSPPTHTPLILQTTLSNHRHPRFKITNTTQISKYKRIQQNCILIFSFLDLGRSGLGDRTLTETVLELAWHGLQVTHAASAVRASFHGFGVLGVCGSEEKKERRCRVSESTIIKIKRMELRINNKKNESRGRGNLHLRILAPGYPQLEHVFFWM